MDCDKMEDFSELLRLTIQLGRAENLAGRPLHKHPNGRAAGKEIADRISAIYGKSLYYRGFHLTAITATYNAAYGTARLGKSGEG